MIRNLAACVTTLTLCNVAMAATIQFSYTFASGETLSGTFEGTVYNGPDQVLKDRGLVQNIHNLNAMYSGLPTATFTHTYPLSAFSLYGTGSMLLFGFHDPIA